MANGNFGGGDGTAHNPFIVEDAMDFLQVNGSNHYAQSRDLDFSNTSTTGVAITLGEGGSYDGRGRKIKNLTSVNDTRNSLLFYEMRGTLKNLEIDSSCFVSGVKSAALRFGMFAGNHVNSSRFINLVNRANFSDSTYERIEVGMISISSVPNNAAPFIGCFNYGNINSKALYGSGITGLSKSRITSCANFGNISLSTTTQYSFASGILPSNDGAIVEDCYNEGAISAKESFGIVCSSGNFTTVNRCVNVGDISGYTRAAGIGGAVKATGCFSLNNFIYRLPGSSSLDINFNRISTNQSSTVVDCYALDTMEFRQK